MSKNVITELVRSLLLGVGAWLVATGKLDEAGLQEIVGSVIGLGSVVWGVVSRMKSAPKPPVNLLLLALLVGMGGSLSSCSGYAGTTILSYDGHSIALQHVQAVTPTKASK